MTDTLSKITDNTGMKIGISDGGVSITTIAVRFSAALPKAPKTLCFDQARSKRSRFITLFHAATKSCTNFSWESSHP